LTWLGVVFNYQLGQRAATRNWKNRQRPDFKVARRAPRGAAGRSATRPTDLTFAFSFFAF
jgi:hypothetical protein